MLDIINSVREWFKGPPPGAITIDTTIYFFEPFDPSTPKGLALLAHEISHVQQWKQEGILKFSFSYINQLRTRGYDQITYEREAKKVEEIVMIYLIDPRLFPTLVRTGELP